MAVSLSACSFGVSAKEGLLPIIEEPGLESFTLIGDLPANVGLKLIASYYTVDEDGRNCMKNPRDFDRFRSRDSFKRYDIPIDAAAQLTKREIPLKHYIGLCELKLLQITMTIHGSDGEQRRQEFTATPNFYVRERSDRVSVTDNFDGKVNLKVDARCAWEVLVTRDDKLSKHLSCQNPSTNLKLDQLAGKSLTLAVAVDLEPRTYYPKTWFKFPQGWKPCVYKDGEWGTCQTPLFFKTFEMNGQTCTVFPGCTEQ